MEWEDHDRWAEKLGISKGISKEVNTIIDAVNQGEDVPDEYEQYLEQCANKVGRDSPNSAFELVAVDYAKRRHDVSRGNKTGDKLSARIHKCAVQKMSDQHLKAWYLHHHLDVLDENCELEKTLDEILSLHKEEAPQTYSKTIADFLRENRDDIPEFD